MKFDKATSVQLSIFTLDDELRAEQMFNEGFGDAPDETQTNRTPSPQKNFLSVASSNAAEQVRMVRTSPGRVDFQIATLEQPLSKVGIPTIDAAAAVEELLTCISQVDFHGKNFLRLAVNASLTMPQKSLEDARDTFFSLTQLPRTVPDAQDLLVQLNRRRKIDDNLEINRLVQYITGIIQVGEFQMNSAGISPAGVSEFHASIIQIDFNTVPGNMLLTPTEVTACFQEICEDVQYAISNPFMESIFHEH